MHKYQVNLIILILLLLIIIVITTLIEFLDPYVLVNPLSKYNV